MLKLTIHNAVTSNNKNLWKKHEPNEPEANEKKKMNEEKAVFFGTKVLLQNNIIM